MSKTKATVLLIGLSGILFCPVVHAALERDPVAIGASVDMGQLVTGKLNDKTNTEFRIENQFLSRTGVYMTESGTFNHRLKIQVTIGGLLWTPLPEPEHWLNRTVLGGLGIGQAQASYRFGNPEKPSATLQFGIFPIKYNPDSKNLGEYLYRSGTYPGVMYTGGWSFLNSAAYTGQGARFSMSHFGGAFNHGLSLTMERDYQRNKDLSPGYVFAWTPFPNFEIGGGAVWTHAIPMGDDSTLSLEVRRNAYNVQTKLPLTRDDAGKTGYVSSDPRVQPDTATCLTDPTVLCPNGSTNDGSFVGVTANGTPGDLLGFYTFRGIKAMARASWNIGAMMGLKETMGPDAFKFYAEWAWLGVKNQPFYYDKPSERMPVMVGLNVPTFGVLDMLGVEVEYRKSRFRNTMFWVMSETSSLPLPMSREEEDYTYYDLNHARYTDSTNANFVWLPGDSTHSDLFGNRDKMDEIMKSDDWKWSVYARKQITKGMTLHAQAASDHLRHFGLQIVPVPGYSPATQRSKDWYYVLRLEFGI